jgi:protein XagA
LTIAAVSLALTAAFLCGPAEAGAWPMEPGRTQAIVKLGAQRANQAFDETGELLPIPAQNNLQADLFVEHGLTKRLTLQGQIYAGSMKEEGLSQAARGHSGLGVRWTAYQGSKGVLAFYTGLTAPVAGSKGARAGLETRIMVGQAIPFGRRKVFTDLQVASLSGTGYGREDRLEGTFGFEMNPNWLAMLQIQKGRVENGTTWQGDDFSLTYHINRNSLQAGWHQTVSGQDVLKTSGPFIGLWRRF